MEHLFTTEAAISLLSLTVLEIILGVDNVVFISIVSGKLPKELQPKARNWGLILAIIPRVLLLLAISWVLTLTQDLVDLHLFGYRFELKGKGLILLIGGIFLIYSSTKEIHHKMTGKDEQEGKAGTASFKKVIFSIVLLNIVFSFDSVLTAVGLAKHVEIMIIAVIISSLIMMGFAGKISDFVNANPTVKVLALSFLLMIGMLLMAEAIEINGHEVEVPKGYVYFAMAFSLFVELLNLRISKTNENSGQGE
ncbi:TerC family protein [uncultured Microscilla sp.]|uniref:TerC family protein n=1 Tax=uncultured Microscilla sp. TaxID=432653 RepID=UPI00262095D9|nr:TerC family protein [uncultured Microscilla sp.]